MLEEIAICAAMVFPILAGFIFFTRTVPITKKWLSEEQLKQREAARQSYELMMESSSRAYEFETALEAVEASGSDPKKISELEIQRAFHTAEFERHRDDLKSHSKVVKYLGVVVSRTMLAAFCLCIAQATFLYVAQIQTWFSAETIPIAALVLDTFSKGLFLDFAESYHLALSNFRPDKQIFLFDTSIFVYRTGWSFVSGYLVFALLNNPDD